MIDLLKISHSTKLFFVECTILQRGCIIIFLFFGLYCHSQKIKIEYPPAPKSDTEDFYFSQVIKDSYRGLENEEDPLVKLWYNKQNTLAITTLNSISGRKEMLKTLLNYDDRVTDVIIQYKIASNGYHFYLKRSKNENIASLYFRKKYNGQEFLLYNPKDYNTQINNNSISYFNPSWDASKVVLAITNSGKEISDLITLNVDDKTIAPEIISGARPDSFLGISWLPDDSGYTFLQFTQDESEPSYSVLYKLGQPPSSITKVFGTALHKNIDIPSKGVYPITKILNQRDSYVIGYVATVENFWETYISDMKEFIRGIPNWKPLHSKKDKIYTDSGRFSKNKYVVKSNKYFESNALYGFSIGDFSIAKAKLLCSPPKEEILQDFIIKNDAIFYTATKNGVSTSLYKCIEGVSTKIVLPNNSGTILLRDNSSDKQSIFVSLSGWTMKNQRYLFNIKNNTFALKPLSTKANYPEFNDIISKEVEITSHDGTQVPLSIVYNKNALLDNSNPTLFYGYGSYGTSLEPFFSTTFLHWVEKGGILCIPHVRGGGEKGEKWHIEGMMNKKENSWKDLIASVEYMIREGYTSSKKTSIYSVSAGGIMIGKAITDRPDLFAAAIAEVPIMNPLRSEARKSGGGSNMLEYGTVKDSLQVKGLIKMDPYLSLERNIQYPAILLTAGENDPRVPKWMPGKFTAKAQEFTSSAKPVLLRINMDSGHGTVDEKTKYYQEYADVFSFAFWQTGHSNFKSDND